MCDHIRSPIRAVDYYGTIWDLPVAGLLPGPASDLCYTPRFVVWLPKIVQAANHDVVHQTTCTTRYSIWASSLVRHTCRRSAIGLSNSDRGNCNECGNPSPGK